MMHVKCSSVYRIVLPVFLCVNLVFSSKNSRKFDEATLRSVGETLGDYGSEKPIDTTANYDSSESLTSFSTGGTLIEDHVLIGPTEGLLNNEVDSVDTPIINTETSKVTISTNEDDERLAGTSIDTSSQDSASASTESNTQENSTSFNEEVNTDPSELNTTNATESSATYANISSPSTNSVSEDTNDDVSVISTSPNPEEEDQSYGTSNPFEERTQTEIENAILENEFSTMQNWELPEKQKDTTFVWSSTISHTNEDDEEETTTNNYEHTTNINSYLTRESLEQNSSPQEDEVDENKVASTMGNSLVQEFTSSSETQENDKVTTTEPINSAETETESESSTETVTKNVDSDSDSETTTYISDVTSESFEDVFGTMETKGKYTSGDLSFDTDDTTVYTDETTTEKIGQTTVTDYHQVELLEHAETTTSNSEQNISEDGTFGQSPTTTEAEAETTESSTSTVTNEDSETTEDQTDIAITNESTTFYHPTWTSLNLVKSSSEYTTEEVSSEANDPSTTGTPEEYSNSKLSEITTASLDHVTTMMSSFVFPDTFPFDSSSTESSTGLFLCDDIEITSHKVTGTGKTDIEVAWTLFHFNSFCELEINLSCNSTDINFDWVIFHQQNTTKVKDSEAVSYLGNLSEFTNYSCVGQLWLKKGEDEMVLKTVTFEVTTKPEVPSNINFNITDVTAESFILSWQRPTKIPGNLQMYHVIIKEKKINHYIPIDACKTLTEICIRFSDENEYLTHNFTSAKPDRLYEVEILAQDEAGNSTGTIKKISTKSSRSTEPLDVTSKLHNYANHCDGDDYNSTMQLEWELPCDTNGELLEFEVQISETIPSKTTSNYSGSETIIYNVPRNADIKNSRYELIVPDLNASCFYEITVAAVTEGNYTGFPANHTTQMTSEGCPSVPEEIHISSLSSYNFVIEWEEPERYFGEILEYNVIITEIGPKHEKPDDESCPEHVTVPTNRTTNARNYTFDSALPNYSYKFMVQARTSAGLGDPTEETEITTKTRESEPIRNLEIREISKNITNEIYESKVRISFTAPCNTNGQFEHYLVKIKGTRFGYPNFYSDTELKDTSLDVILKNPEYNYTFDIRVITDDFVSRGQTMNIVTTAGILKLNEEKMECVVDEDYPTEIKVNIRKEIFGQQNGVITNYAIYLFEDVEENLKLGKPSFGVCDGTCPLVNETYEDLKAKTIYLVSSVNWNPFTGENKQVSITIGERDDCSSDEICQSLSEKTNYIVLLRGCTSSTYRDVFYLVKTGTKSSNVGFYLVTIIIIIVIVVLGVYLYLRKESYLTIFRSIPNTPEEPIQRHLVSVKHFKSYYSKTQNDPTILRKQYEEIEDEIKKYKEENVHTTFALKPENKRKNRYTNILPYDEYRVKLQMDEDDEISSDYINASYIRGASGEVEYIATQGPLEHTCKDFWKMVVQENVTVIVMVSQFIEKEKEKCFKYFPNNHENMMICEDLEVKCLTELQFDTHCIRTLLIRKDLKQFSVIHMQYLDWPDFGCPSGTYNMLSFCREVRDRIQIEKGLMAVHCSAGVGRTGTLISLDILLQTMQKKKEISIFECVMDLRKQRTHMVQTEKQYVYIYTCLNDVLENCSLYSFDDTKKDDDHIYVNVDEKHRSIKQFRCEEDESAF